MLNNVQKKELMRLEDKWIVHKRLQHKCAETSNKGFLTIKERENMIEELFKIMKND